MIPSIVLDEFHMHTGGIDNRRADEADCFLEIVTNHSEVSILHHEQLVVIICTDYYFPLYMNNSTVQY